MKGKRNGRRKFVSNKIIILETSSVPFLFLSLFYSFLIFFSFFFETDEVSKIINLFETNFLRPFLFPFIFFFSSISFLSFIPICFIFCLLSDFFWFHL